MIARYLKKLNLSQIMKKLLVENNLNGKFLSGKTYRLYIYCYGIEKRQNLFENLCLIAPA